MAVNVEVYQVGGTAPDALWDVVGDPWRLAEWTDAERVEQVEPQPLAVGTRIVTVEAAATRTWRVMTAEQRLLEVATTTDRGELAVGWRVARDPLGSRLILAGGLQPAGGGRWRARLVDAPALRRRLDRWCHAALRVAARGS